MAAGDVVSALGDIATNLDFQPAVGVECLITQVFRGDTQGYVALFDGVNVAYSSLGITTNEIVVKIFINNSLYLRVQANAGVRNAYCGIQIK